MGCGSSSTATDPNNNVRKDKNEKGGKGQAVKRKGGHEAELTSEPDIEDIDVPKTEVGYPPISIPHGKKEDILKTKLKNRADTRARATPADKADSYEALVAYLTESCQTDVEKVRAIFMWMGNQDIKKGNYSGVTDSETPRGFMKLMSENRASYSSFFSLLCRKAGVPCVIIDGVAKACTYEVGDSEERVKTMRNSWNAVYCDGNWRIVFPLWACSAVSGYSSGLYTKVETKGQAVREKQSESSGTTIKHLNEFYFFIDPEILIHMAFPNDSKWQLVSKKWDFSKFCRIPECEQSYFKQNMEVKNKFIGILKTKDGECLIELASDDPEGLNLDYEFYYNNKESGQEISDSLQLNNYVLMERSLSSWRFCIRFPESGVYKLQIVGGRGYEVDLCAFKIICDTPMKDCKPLPFNPGQVGYGPNHDTELAGIVAKSHRHGIVKMVVRKQMEFNFALTRDLQMKTQLVHPTIPPEELAKYCKQTQRHRNVSVQVCVPDEGEYALKIDAQQNGEATSKNVCNYLLTSDGGKKKKRKEYENPIEKRTREDMKTYTKSPGTENIEELEITIDKFIDLGLEDKGDLTAAQDSLEYKKDRKQLDDAIKRRHLETLDKAIDNGHRSRFKPRLTKPITEAEGVRDHLRHLTVIAHDILDMKQETISELRSYKVPQKIIYDIMRSTFLMLGQDDNTLEDWEDLQILMGKLGKDSLIRRVRKFDTVNVQPNIKYQVERTLEQYTENDARKASAGAGTFYVWLRDVCTAIDSQQEANDRTPPQE